jgi:hypothetical protein
LVSDDIGLKMLWEMVHADRVLRAFLRDPNVHVCDVSLFECQKDEHRPYTNAEIEHLKSRFRQYNWTGYLKLFHKEDREHHTFETGWPGQPDPALIGEFLPPPDRIEGN